jgi:hypothetical protein
MIAEFGKLSNNALITLAFIILCACFCISSIFRSIFVYRKTKVREIANPLKNMKRIPNVFRTHEGKFQKLNGDYYIKNDGSTYFEDFCVWEESKPSEVREGDIIL